MKKNKEIIFIIRKMFENDHLRDFIVHGGSSLIYRQNELQKKEFRTSVDVDLKAISGIKKSNLSSNRMVEELRKMTDVFSDVHLHWENEKSNSFISKISVKTIDGNNETIKVIEWKKNDFIDKEDYETIGGVRVVNLSKIFSDKLFILIDYSREGILDTNNNIRHLLDIVHIHNEYKEYLSLEKITFYLNQRINLENKERTNLDEKYLYEFKSFVKEIVSFLDSYVYSKNKKDHRTKVEYVKSSLKDRLVDFEAVDFSSSSIGKLSYFIKKGL